MIELCCHVFLKTVDDDDATDDDYDGENYDDCDDIHRIVKREGSDQT